MVGPARGAGPFPGRQASVRDDAPPDTATRYHPRRGRCYTPKVARRTQKIDELLAVLEKTGADPERLDVLRATQRFKRSWVDLAEVLVRARRDGSFEQWGYEDFYKYCSDELQLRRATVDKLTISYSTIKKHAPQVLKRDGVAKTIPSYQAVDYFGRMMPEQDSANDEGNSRRRTPPPEQVNELRTAVFQEGQSVAELRKRFDPVFRPKPRGAKKLEIIAQASRLANKLAQLLPDIDGLTEKRVRQLESALGGLRSDLEELAAPLKQRVAKARRKAPPRPAARA